MERYRELWMEIESKYGKSSEIDSVAIVEANRLAIELAQYDGPMAQVFEFIEAGLEIATDLEGPIHQEDQEDLSQRMGNYSLSGANCPDCKSLSDCTNRCEETRHQDDMETGAWATGEAVLCGAAAAKALIKRPTLGGLFGVSIVKAGCISKVA